jgi:O-antigen/teichoic acid export membrane protein
MTASEHSSFKATVMRGLLWLTAGTFIGQFISWLSTIFVIRLLHPQDYGIMAMAGSFIFLLTTVSELGIGGAVIQAEKITEREIGQIFGFALATSLAGFLLCYTTAPAVAHFYREPKLVPAFRVLGLNIIFMALYLIPQAMFAREMDFKTKAKIDIAAQIIASLTTLLLAWYGSGAWALIMGMITYHITKAISFNTSRPVWIKPVFSYKGSRQFIVYGITLTGSRVLYSLYTLSDTIIIGKFLDKFSLGIYSVAVNLASLPAEKVMPIINQITFTSHSRIQNDRDRVKKNLLMTTRTVAFAGFPIFFGMASVADEAIPLILGAKWTSVILPFQLLCLVLPFKSLNPTVSSTLNAIGEPRVNLINTAVTSLLMISGFLVGVQKGVTGVCLVWTAVYPVAFLITIFYSLKVLQIPVKDFFAEIRYPLSASLFMAAFIHLLRKVTPALPPVSVLILLIASGVCCYMAAAIVFKRDQYQELIKMLRCRDMKAAKPS